MGRALPLRLPIGGDRLATGPGCAMLAECPGQLLAELSVLFPEAAEFGACSLEAALQGGVGGALARGDDGAGGGAGLVAAEPLDLGTEVRLGVEP
jgi:hypothetical protein